MHKILKYLYESWSIWFIAWLLGSMGWMAYTVLSVMASPDPSARAILGFLPLIFPIFFIWPGIIVLTAMFLYKLSYWLYGKYTNNK